MLPKRPRPPLTPLPENSTKKIQMNTNEKLMNEYLESAKNTFRQYKALGEKTYAQLSDEQLCLTVGEASNSIVTIVKHLRGNMLSRWTDFLTTDGEKPDRNRDAEFEPELTDRSALMSQWNEGWNCLLNTLDGLSASDLSRQVLIRNEPHTVVAAINRQLAHYAYHVGQIVYLGKMLCNNNWKSLSIPRGGSEAYNERVFAGKNPSQEDDNNNL
jgi:hypothetical protein